MPFKTKLKIVLITGIFMALTLNIISKYYTIAFAQQECTPHKVFFIEKGKIPYRGEYVYFKGTHVPFYGEEIKLVKLLVATPYEDIIVERAKKPETRKLNIKGIEKEYTVKSYVKVPYKAMVLPAFEKGSSGKPLPQLPEGLITLKGYFVIGTHEGSYDSRYFGGIPEGDILGKAHPIL